MMKKILLFLTVCATSMGAFAQYASDSSASFFSSEKSDEQVSFGIRTGINFNNYSLSSGKASLSYDNGIGYHAGVVVDVPILESLHFEPGLYLTSKNFKNNEGVSVKYSPAFLEVPLLASFRFGLTESIRWHVNIGPYVGVGIFGKIKADGYESDDFFDDNGFKRFDMGLSTGTGFSFNKLYLGVNYNIGLLNTLDDNEISGKYRSLQVTLGYNF